MNEQYIIIYHIGISYWNVVTMAKFRSLALCQALMMFCYKTQENLPGDKKIDFSLSFFFETLSTCATPQ